MVYREFSALCRGGSWFRFSPLNHGMFDIGSTFVSLLLISCSISSVELSTRSLFCMANPNRFQRLLQRKAAQLGPGHYLLTTITSDNALLCLSTVHSTTEVEFDFVMAYICVMYDTVLNPGGDDFIILCHNVELMMRCYRWLSRELHRTDDDEGEWI